MKPVTFNKGMWAYLNAFGLQLAFGGQMSPKQINL